MDILLGLKTTLKRIEKLVCIQKEQCDEIKDRVEMIVKAQVISKEQADESKAQVTAIKGKAASREQADTLQNKLCSISRLQSRLQRKQAQIACTSSFMSCRTFVSLCMELTHSLSFMIPTTQYNCK